MTAGSLPLEIFTRIVQHCRSSTELPPLCRLNKAFQRVAERRLYRHLVLGDMGVAFLACISLILHGGLRGAYVERFWFYTDPRRATSRAPLLPPFWHTLHAALASMTQLKDLMISDPAETSSWMLDPEDFKFQLHTARLRLAWDENMVAFLQTQPQLKHLQTLDAPDISDVCGLPGGHLQALESFDGPLLVAAEVYMSPRLTHLRTAVDDDVFHLLPQFVENTVSANTPLCSLHVNIIPETIITQTLEVLTSDPKWCVRLKHLGIIAMPVQNRHNIHRHLMKLYNLHTIAFEVSHMEPVPIEIMQRALAMEMHMFCPSLRRVAFWFGQEQVVLWQNRQDVWAHSATRLSSQVDDQLWLSV